MIINPVYRWSLRVHRLLLDFLDALADNYSDLVADPDLKKNLQEYYRRRAILHWQGMHLADLLDAQEKRFRLVEKAPMN